MEGKDLKRKSTTDRPISFLMKDDNQTDKDQAVKKQKSNHHENKNVDNIVCEGTITTTEETSETTTTIKNESSREQIVIRSVFRQRYLLRLIMEKVKELSNIRGLTPVFFFTKKLISPHTPSVVLPEDYKLSGITNIPNRASPVFDIPPNPKRYMDIDDISWMCRNKYTALLRYKLERNEPLRLTDIRSTYKTIGTDKQLFKQLYERHPNSFAGSLPNLIQQDITRDMLEFIMNDLMPSSNNIIQILHNFIKSNNLEFVELMLTFQTPTPNSYQELPLVQSSIKSGLAMVKLLTPRFRPLYIAYSNNDEIFMNLLETRDLELIDYFQSNFGLVFKQNIYDNYNFNGVSKVVSKETNNQESIERNEHTITKIVEILNSKTSGVEITRRLAELERSKYGNGGVPITESDAINMREYMIRYYPLVMLGEEPFFPESDQQLPIVQYIVEEKKDTIGANALTSLFYAISNGLKQITNYLINNVDISNLIMNNVPYHSGSVKTKCISSAIQTKQFDIVDLLFSKWRTMLEERQVLNIIRKAGSFAALQLFFKHFSRAALGTRFHCTNIGYMLDNLQAEEFEIECDNIDNNLDFTVCGQVGLPAIIIAYLKFKKDRFNTNNLEAALYAAAKHNQLNFLLEVHKLMPDYRFKMTTNMRGTQGINKSTVEYFNETFKLQTAKPTTKKKKK
ncbi:hypothetical protein PPL_00677 [Heterostelium album PN500]|uniref:Ankyrin repeat-containing protein n=1 Tax=Heterostelium pallidum (strain ATCC 26659 / Pp 5 / PN500) TaxID=670386 RepID=D3AX48_HETP5|nr:hypothetical protein PPL_00677 [Heterostelium album PN500]EFA86117.1 hypothetical protein PPL_00677 [Heterostelium album PN500]|eukprot:XP_020438222.1 hypothetical protein PPL_00677 [Heterostelium album PN500]